MAEVVPEKSRALKFAEQQLLRHGWEHGKGLGRKENGMAEAIQVKVKCDKGGVGHKEGEQFTFHWWDHVFNKASASLQVESDQNGVQLKKTVEEDEEDGMISNKKPRKAALAKAKLYGCFVKSATLLSGQEQPDPKPSSSDDSSSSSDEEDDQKLDLSSTTKLSDADLMRACGGRTAHKGARHGLTMSAKLARLEKQEAEFMAKYSKKSQPASAPPVCVAPTPPTSQSADQRAERQEETVKDSRRKKIRSTGSVIYLDSEEVSVSPETDVDPRKKKKKKKKVQVDSGVITDGDSTDDVICVGNSEADHSHKTKRKHKNKNNNAEQNEEERTAAAESRSQEETVELHTEVKKKKRKSCKTHSEAAEEEEGNNTEPSQSEPVQDCAPKPKKKRAAVLLEEAEVTEEVKQKRKKCKRDKSYVDNDSNEETLPPKKKKKKKKSKE